MAKRSEFPRIHKDQYMTIDPRAVQALVPYLEPNTKYAEPCCGKGDLVDELYKYGHECRWMSDIDNGSSSRNALTITKNDLKFDIDLIITNPPWTRSILHPLIEHLASLKPTWLLFDADWMHTKQSSDIIKRLCTDIVSIGRLKWIPDTTMVGKDNCAWYKFICNKIQNPNLDVRFHGR